MNIEAIRSFLDVAETGSFNLAAARVNVTQSTVSTRIQALEENLGILLFRRSRSGVELTSAGSEFHSYAAQIVSAWNQARLHIALPEGYDAIFRLGGPVALQEWLSLSWILWMKENAPTVALQVDASTSDVLCDRLLAQTLDAAIMYMPQRRPGLVIEVLLQEELVMVRHPQMRGEWFHNYVFVDWGPEFAAGFRQAFPNATAPTITVGTSVLGLSYVFALKGAAYLPASLVQDAVSAGQLAVVDAAPRFQQPIHLVYPTQARDPKLLDMVASGIRRIAHEKSVLTPPQPS